MGGHRTARRPYRSASVRPADGPANLGTAGREVDHGVVLTHRRCTPSRIGDMPKPDAVAVLAGKMIVTLECLRDEGAAYPPSLSHLTAQANPQAPPQLAAKALKKKPFADRLLAAGQAPRQPRCLGRRRRPPRRRPAPGRIRPVVVMYAGKASSPTHQVGNQGGQGVETSVRGRPATPDRGKNAAGNGRRRGGEGQAATLSADAAAAGRGAVSRRRCGRWRRCGRKGKNAYPPSLKELIRGRPRLALRRRRRRRPCRRSPAGAVRLAPPPRPAGGSGRGPGRPARQPRPVGVRPECRPQTRPSGRAVDGPEKEDSEAATSRVRGGRRRPRRRRGAASPAVGRLYVKQKPHSSYCATWSSAEGRQPPDEGADAPRSPTPVDFAALFDAAFDHLDRQKGSHNLVSLLDLRPAVAAGSRRLRRRLAPASSGRPLHPGHGRRPSRRQPGGARRRPRRGRRAPAVRLEKDGSTDFVNRLPSEAVP